MELEQRVKTLEYEVKILKNEIQRTLLDIQEQVLIHYYPTLRADESKPSEGTIQALEALRAKQTTSAAAAAGPGMKKVSLEEIRAAQSELTSNAAATGTPADATSLNKLVEWAKQADVTQSKSGPEDQAAIKLLETLSSGVAKAGEGGGKPSEEMLNQLAKVNSIVASSGSMEEAMQKIKEGKLG
jgi:hypothetical protein